MPRDTPRFPSTGPLAPESLPTLQRARLTQSADELCLSVVQGLTGRVQLRRRGPTWYEDRKYLRLPAPQLHTQPEQDGWNDYRGAADGVAQWLTASDPRLYAEQEPQSGSLAMVLFAVLEQIRVEALASQSLPGMRHNLDYRHGSWVDQFMASSMTDNERGLNILAVDLTARAHILGLRIGDGLADMLESTRWHLSGVVGADLRALRDCVGDQRRYGEYAARIAVAVADRVESSDHSANKRTDGQAAPQSGFSLLVGIEDGDDTPVASLGRSHLLGRSNTGYRVFTKAYDRVETGSGLARAAMLETKRAELDSLVRASCISVPALARRLRAILCSKEPGTWIGGKDHGVVDGRRLARLVAMPTDHHLFRSPEPRVTAMTSVTFLLDLSGSMRTHREYLATLVDVCSRALDQARVPHEILGFTTTGWQGGPARASWERSGRPLHPGRLAALRHIVLKSAERTWRRQRNSIAALLVPQMYREGVDGEALSWAASRASSLATDRHLLVVLSDGSPSERSTALANDEHYLEVHLQQTVDSLSTTPGFGVCALGVGLDLSPYYRHSLVVHDPSPAAARIGLADLMALLAG